MNVTLVDKMGSDLTECRGCQELKPPEEFPVRKDRSGRRRPYCKPCCNDSARKRYESHKRNNPFKLKCNRAKARASQLGLPFDLTPEYLESLWTGKCPILDCEIFLDTDRDNEFAAELDRFIPEKGYVKGNVNFLSRRMNRLKNDVNLEEIKKLAEWMEDVGA